MPFMPGQVGNPQGRPPKFKSWADAIQRAIKRRESVDPTALEKLADRLIQKVEEGDIAAIKEFGDRMDGKVPQAIVGDDDHPPVLNTSVADSVLTRYISQLNEETK